MHIIITFLLLFIVIRVFDVTTFWHVFEAGVDYVEQSDSRARIRGWS